VTVLSERGAPTPVASTILRATRSTMGQPDPAEQQQAVATSPLQERYGQPLDREFAHERLAAPMTPPAPTPGTGPTRALEPERQATGRLMEGDAAGRPTTAWSSPC
jgi:hypothetical protein